MATEVTGTVHGSTITLDAPVPPLDGRRVRVVLEAADTADLVLSEQEQDRLWREWVDHGPQGPLDGEDTWPDEA
jgi:predicted thioesterase